MYDLPAAATIGKVAAFPFPVFETTFEEELAADDDDMAKFLPGLRIEGVSSAEK